MNTRRLTKKEMWIFAIGQLGWSILGGIINTWLVTFYLPTSGSLEAGAKFYVPTGLMVFGVGTLILLYLFMTMYCTSYNALISEFFKTQEDTLGGTGQTIGEDI